MKILHIVPSLSLGGAEMIAIQQVNWMKKERIPVHLMILTSKSDLLPQVYLNETEVHSLNRNKLLTLGYSSIYESIRSIKIIKSMIKSVRPDIIISHLPIAHFTSRLALISSKELRENVKLFNYHHSIQFEANPLNSWFKKIFHAVNRIMGKKIDYAHIFISDAVKRNIANYFFIERYKIIKNGIEPKEPNTKAASKLLGGLHYNKLLLIPGRLHPSKGQLFFINTTSQILKTNSEVLVVLAGAGPDEQVIENKVRELRLESKVLLTGSVENEVILGLMKLSTIVIIPSISEGFGITAIEAMSLGKTVLASDAGGLSEIVKAGYNGYQFEAGNSESLLEKLQSLLGGDLEVIREERIVQDFKENFSVSEQMNELIKFIQD